MLALQTAILWLSPSFEWGVGRLWSVQSLTTGMDQIVDFSLSFPWLGLHGDIHRTMISNCMSAELQVVAEWKDIDVLKHINFATCTHGEVLQT